MFSRRSLIRFALLWIALIIVGSLWPPGPKIALGTLTHSKDPAVRHRAEIRHRLAHFGVFGIAALLLAVVAANTKKRIAAIAGVIALAAVIEWLQHIIYASPFEYWDVRDDTFAAIAGSALGAWQMVRAHLLRKPHEYTPYSEIRSLPDDIAR